MPQLKRLGALMGLVLLLLSIGLAWVLWPKASYAISDGQSPTDVKQALQPAVAGENKSEHRIVPGQISTPTLDIFVYLPIVSKRIPFVCPASSEVYSLIPLPDLPPGQLAIDHPDVLHGDLNLAMRGYSQVVGLAPIYQTMTSPPSLGHSNPIFAPRLSTLFSDGRVPGITALYQVNGWEWDPAQCAGNPHGCQEAPLTPPSPYQVTLMGLLASQGETLHLPARDDEIYSGGFKAVVVYADTNRITLSYNHKDGVAEGYAIHLENLCVDDNLLALYQAQNDSSGFRATQTLPGLKSGQVLGAALDEEVLVAIRYYGNFMDPRSIGEWWQPFQLTSLISEDFSGGIPSNWTVIDGGTGGGPAATWTTDNPGFRVITASINAPFAIVDSAEAGP